MAKQTNTPVKRHKRALTYLEGAKVTRTQLAAKMGVTVHYAGTLLKDLQRFGLITIAGTTPSCSPIHKGPSQWLWMAVPPPPPTESTTWHNSSAWPASAATRKSAR